MKDVVICDKSRGGDKQPLIRESPNAETRQSRPLSLIRVSLDLIYIEDSEIRVGANSGN